MNDTCSITTTLRRGSHKLPRRTLLHSIKRRVLGTSYRLSVAFVGNKRMQTLNRRYRGKDTPTNVLAFPLGTAEGEIIIAIPKAHVEAKQFNRTPREHIIALVIHGCLHLKGHRHGHIMEQQEQALIRQFR